MILLDTHAVIWLAQRHRRAKPLQQFASLYLSPASMLEIQFLAEVGRLRMRRLPASVALAADPRWRIDDPPAGKWFTEACDLGWTHDPFDRLIAAHARVRGWKLATADDLLLEHLPAAAVVPL